MTDQRIGTIADLGKAWPLATSFSFVILVTSDGTATGTAVAMTGHTSEFVLRDFLADGEIDNVSAALLTLTSPTKIVYSNSAGTDDKVTVTVTNTDLAITMRARKIHWTFWDTTSHVPRASGTVILYDPGAP